MPSGPRPVSIVAATSGSAGASVAVAVGVGVAGGGRGRLLVEDAGRAHARDEDRGQQRRHHREDDLHRPALVATNSATALISSADSWPLNDGIVPPPEVTIASTRAASGLRSSRFGPTAPEASAAASVWQLAHEEAKTAWPGAAAGSPAGAGVARGALLLGADQRRAREQRDHDERRGDPGHHGEHAIQAGEHVYGAGMPFSEMNHSPLVIHVATSTQKIVPPASGSARPGSLGERTTTTLTANAP